MLELERKLAARLRARRVRIEVADGDTVVFRNVPTNLHFFNKSRTNLLFKRPSTGMPFLVGVDADLEYYGPDAFMNRLFQASGTQQGWRVLRLASSLQTDFHEAVTSALTVLGFEEGEPAVTVLKPPTTSHDGGKLLTNFGTNLSRVVDDSKAECTIGRQEQIDTVAACMLCWGETRSAVIVGESGVGKTNLLHAVAAKLSRHGPGRELISVDLGVLLAGTLFDAERENLLCVLLKEVAALPGTILALEHLELAASLPHGPLLLARHMDNGTRLIGTTLPKYLSCFEGTAILARRLNVVELNELSPNETVSVLRVVAASIARHHEVEIGESCIPGCVQAARSFPGYFPAKAIALLDAASARAGLSGTKIIGPDEIYAAATQSGEQQ